MNQIFSYTRHRWQHTSMLNQVLQEASNPVLYSEPHKRSPSTTEDSVATIARTIFTADIDAALVLHVEGMSKIRRSAQRSVADLAAASMVLYTPGYRFFILCASICFC